MVRQYEKQPSPAVSALRIDFHPFWDRTVEPVVCRPDAEQAPAVLAAGGRQAGSDTRIADEPPPRGEFCLWGGRGGSAAAPGPRRQARSLCRETTVCNRGPKKALPFRRGKTEATRAPIRPGAFGSGRAAAVLCSGLPECCEDGISKGNPCRGRRCRRRSRSGGSARRRVTRVGGTPRFQ